MATYQVTQPVAHRHALRTVMAALVLAGTLAIGVGIGRTTSPEPVVSWHPESLTIPWRAGYIRAINHMELQKEHQATQVPTSQGRS